jgi:hypothetical protein
MFDNVCYVKSKIESRPPSLSAALILSSPSQASPGHTRQRLHISDESLGGRHKTRFALSAIALNINSAAQPSA